MISAQAPQSPHTDNYTVFMSQKRNNVFVTQTDSELQFHRFIYTRHFDVVSEGQH